MEKYTKDENIKNIIIVTHTCPKKKFCNKEELSSTNMNTQYLKLIEKYNKISHWIFGHTHNTFEVKCKNRWAGVFGGGNIKVRENILLPVLKTITYASQQIKTADDNFNFPSPNDPPFIKSSLTEFCPGDPNAPVEEMQPEKKDKPKQPVKINCDSPVWKNRPRCN